MQYNIGRILSLQLRIHQEYIKGVSKKGGLVYYLILISSKYRENTLFVFRSNTKYLDFEKCNYITKTPNTTNAQTNL